jgi:excisionase family DNA binding protein
MSESKPQPRKLAVRATRAVAFPDASQAGVTSAFQPPIYHPSQWLSLAEGAAYTGLPQSTLRRLLATRKLPALDTGPRFGGRWRIKRSDLDAISAI